MRKQYDIGAAWARATTSRMQPGGDLYRRPLTRAEMEAPLSFSEKQDARPHRFGERADGSVGWIRRTRDGRWVPSNARTTDEKIAEIAADP